MKPSRVPLLVLVVFTIVFLLSYLARGAEPAWQRISSKTGGLPAPGASTQQTGALVGDFDRDGIREFVLSFRQTGPALVWHRRAASGWDRYVIEKDFLPVEAGGAAHDIDGDGDLDIVFGGDYSSSEVWWWENPWPDFQPEAPWRDHTIKSGGKKQHPNQVFGDFKGTRFPQLAFWNQQAKAIFLADIPADPRSSGPWPAAAIFTGFAGETGGRGGFLYAEGMDKADVDGDGRPDLLAGNFWLKHLGETNFLPVKVGAIGGRIRAGQLKKGGPLEIVIAPGDGVGPLRWHECVGNPTNAADWVAHDLAGRDLIHGHTLELGDVDGDGHLDIFAAEMAKWTESRAEPDNPQARAWIFYGDGQGNFRKMEITTGEGWHEGRLADFDGDGDLDLLQKPYNWDAPRVDVWLNRGAGPRLGAGTGGSFKGPLGLQFYTLRHQFQKNVPYVLERVRDFGFVEIEGGGNYGYGNERFRKMLDAHGLKMISYFAGYDLLRTNVDRAIAGAKDFGAKYIVCAWIPHERGKFSEKNCRDAAALFNEIGEKIRQAGLRFAYHLHGYEFQPHGDGTLFDLMAAETRPPDVAFQMDVYWVAHGGADPTHLMRKYGSRFEMMHVKDLKKGVKGDLVGLSPDDWNVPVGQGQIDWPSLLREAERAGVKHYFIEDEAVDAINQVPESLQYLRQLRW